MIKTQKYKYAWFLFFLFLCNAFFTFSEDWDNLREPAGRQPEITWINMYTYDNIFYPVSMPAYVSAGLLYDEIDIMLRYPAELAHYTGYSVYSAYANTDYRKFHGTVPAFTNPLGTSQMAQTGDAQNLTDVLVAYGLPFKKLRIGLLGGFTLSENAGLLIDTVALNRWNHSESEHIDADANAADDAIWSDEQGYIDFTANTKFTGGVGIGLNNIGISLFLYINGAIRSLGGSYVHNYEAKEIPMAYDSIESKVVTYGAGANGAVTFYPSVPSEWGTRATFQFPLMSDALTLPVTTGITFSGSSGGVLSADPPMTLQINAKNVTDAIAGESSISTFTSTTGQAMNTGWDPSATSGVLGGISLFNRNDFRLLIDTQLTADQAYALKASQKWSFTTGVDGNIDPRLLLNEYFTIRSRGFIQYAFTVSDQSETHKKTVSYSEANSVSSINSEYTFTENFQAPFISTMHSFNLETGGILEFSDNTFVTIGTGFFYRPSFSIYIEDLGTQLTTRDYSWWDRENLDALANSGVTSVGDIKPGSYQGSAHYEEQIQYNGNNRESNILHNFYIPVSLTLNLVKDKLTFISGYILNHQIATKFTVQADAINTTVNHIYNTVNETAASVVYSDVAVNIVSGGSTSEFSLNSSWTGEMNFMLRWIPVPSVTADFFGKMLINALNFNFLGGEPFLNPSQILSSIGVSLSIRVGKVLPKAL